MTPVEALAHALRDYEVDPTPAGVLEALRALDFDVVPVRDMSGTLPGSAVTFRAQERGTYVAKGAGGVWTLEKRRAEAGSPAGWYLYGPDGVPSGEYMAATVFQAITTAERAVTPAPTQEPPS